MKTIHLSFDNVDAAISEVFNYRYDVLERIEKLRAWMVETIRAQAEMRFNGAILTDTFMAVQGKEATVESATLANVSVTVELGENVTFIIANGEDAVWVEFGAGVFYNGDAGSYPNPYAITMGMSAIGTYGEGHGAYDEWAFPGKDGKHHRTHGTPAAMPLYRAVQSVVEQYVAKAQEVFSK